MKSNYAKKKRIKSLATRYLRKYDNLLDSRDLNEVYNSDFLAFAENLLVDLCGFKKDLPPKKHRPRKIGTRPPKRKVGTRPLRIGETIKPDSPSQLTKYSEETARKIEKDLDQTQPAWYKKAWRNLMMQVHPDRIDLVSKDEIDKLERLKIGNRLRIDPSSDLLVACCNSLDSKIDLNVYEQERLLRLGLIKMDKEIKDIQSTVAWIWGESLIDNNVRKDIIKSILENNKIEPPSDEVLFDYILKNLV